jgi:hypothetical protein
LVGFVAGPSHKTDQKSAKALLGTPPLAPATSCMCIVQSYLIATENHVHAIIASFPVAQPCEHVDKQSQARGIVDG